MQTTLKQLQPLRTHESIEIKITPKYMSQERKSLPDAKLDIRTLKQSQKSHVNLDLETDSREDAKSKHSHQGSQERKSKKA